MYEIRTAYGQRYLTDDEGYVLEYSNGLRKDAKSEERKSWRITGAWYNVGFGYIRLITLLRLSAVSADFLRLKNGKPRYGLTDIDHGALRIHGNKECHGVVSCVHTAEEESEA